MFFYLFLLLFCFCIKKNLCIQKNTKKYVYIDVNSSSQMTNRFKNDMLYIINKIIYLSQLSCT